MLLLLLFPALLLGESPIHFGHQAWSTEDGLPQNSVRQVLQTSDGYIWVATEGGLARFDGLSFTVFRQEDEPSFLSDDVACLTQTNDGSLWIGTTDGLLRYKNSRFDRVSLAIERDQQSILSLAAAADGSVLVLTSGGLIRLVDGRAAPLVDLPSSVQTLAEAPNGAVWLSSGARLLQLRGHRLLEKASLPESPLGLQIDRGGTVWVRSASGISAVQPKGPEGSVTRRDLPRGLVSTFLRDNTGRLWIGTTRGLYLKAGADARPVLVEELASRSILSLTQDREGSLWVGTEADGVHILRSQKFAIKPELNDQVITALAQTTDGAIWMGTRGDGLRVSRRSGNGAFGPAERPRLSGRLESPFILALASGVQGDLWVGTLDGLDHVQHGRIERFSSADGLPDDVIRSLLVDRDGWLWIGTRRGLVHWRGVRGAGFVRVEGLPSDLIGAMLRTPAREGSSDSNGALWVATLAGISQLDGERVVRNLVLPRHAESSAVTSMAESGSGSLWVGTRDGQLADVATQGTRDIVAGGTPQKINSLVADDLGSLWIGSARGIYRFAAADLKTCLAAATCAPSLAHLGFADGMPTEETTAIGHPSALRTADGDLWFATTRGVAILDPRHLQQNPVPPPTIIEHFVVDASDKLRSPAPYRIPFGRASMTFDYVGLSFLAPSRVRYRYQLEGFDRQWTEAGARRSAYYTNLPPGHYTFKVQAANNDGVWNRNGAALTFSILPPFYRRLWFYALALLVLAALVYGIYYLRVRRLRSEFDAVLAERNRIAREIHDTLAQNFVGISIHLQLVEQLLRVNDLSGIETQLQQTRALVQEGLNDARQSIWELRASVAQDSLPTRLSRAVERSALSGPGTQAITGEVKIGGIYRPLETQVENEILRIAGEALTNVKRHANASAAAVSLSYGSDRLRLTVTDNGRGFDPDAVASTDDHFGLQGMRERTAAIGATLSVVSSPGTGTTITLTVPLPRAERRTS